MHPSETLSAAAGSTHENADRIFVDSGQATVATMGDPLRQFAERHGVGILALRNMSPADASVNALPRSPHAWASPCLLVDPTMVPLHDRALRALSCADHRGNQREKLMEIASTAHKILRHIVNTKEPSGGLPALVSLHSWLCSPDGLEQFLSVAPALAAVHPKSSMRLLYLEAYSVHWHVLLLGDDSEIGLDPHITRGRRGKW